MRGEGADRRVEARHVLGGEHIAHFGFVAGRIERGDGLRRVALENARIAPIRRSVRSASARTEARAASIIAAAASCVAAIASCAACSPSSTRAIAISTASSGARVAGIFFGGGTRGFDMHPPRGGALTEPAGRPQNADARSTGDAPREGCYPALRAP